MRFENGKMTENSPVHIRRLRLQKTMNMIIYHVYIKDPENNSYMMQPKVMRIIKNEGFSTTLEGLRSKI